MEMEILEECGERTSKQVSAMEDLEQKAKKLATLAKEICWPMRRLEKEGP